MSRRPACSQVLVELVYPRVSQINNCLLARHAYPRSHDDGVPTKKLALIQAWEDGGNLFTDTERAALARVEMVTRVPQTGVLDETYQAAARSFARRNSIAISLVNGLQPNGDQLP
jgi:alkylhydroperoxidase family enzyme